MQQQTAVVIVTELAQSGSGPIATLALSENFRPWWTMQRLGDLAPPSSIGGAQVEHQLAVVLAGYLVCRGLATPDVSRLVQSRTENKWDVARLTEIEAMQIYRSAARVLTAEVLIFEGTCITEQGLVAAQEWLTLRVSDRRRVQTGA